MPGEPPPLRANITVIGDEFNLPPGAANTAHARNPTRLWTPAELSRFYRRLHPIRHSVARIRRRMQREREIEDEIENQRSAFLERESLMRKAGAPRISEEVRQRALRQWSEWDPLAQFSERSERIFQEAMYREMDELAAQIGRLSIQGRPRETLFIDRDGNMRIAGYDPKPEVEEVD